ncbi:MAG: FAD-dependent oxidoreductase [Candidatus Midichloria sp.]|nr:MAG: FAD-dependent oxidoreductase [Candidatus Midichloria sp.]
MIKFKILKYVTFSDLYQREGLLKIDQIFCRELKEFDEGLYGDFVKSRNINFAGSDLLIKLAPFVEKFISNLFNINLEINKLQEIQQELDILFECKRNFIQRRVAKQTNFTIEEIETNILNVKEKLAKYGFDFYSEISMAKSIMQWQQENNEELIDAAIIYAAWSLQHNKNSILFSLPEKIDFEDLIKFDSVGGIIKKTDKELRNRDKFNLNDEGLSKIRAVGEAKYCIHCHKQQKDSCSKGLKRDEAIAKNSLGIALHGCPLKEKISEMNLLRANGLVLAPLAVAIIDNPMLAATGHRICNDCMKSCIYQKQKPVDIPLVETETLQTVLELPYGFEIYSLLTRWNPLNFKQWLPMPYNDYKVLVVGLGPAGFTLAHYLLNQGVSVVAIDGLKIEPLNQLLSGVCADGKRTEFLSIKNITDIYESLNDRVGAGFGGVTEYGITVRWNKNYLKVIRLLLERRSNFRMYGGVRFGSNITYTQAKELGFDHIALALGAGSPNLLDIPNALAGGVRTASDFLMSLQLFGPARQQSLANLQIELPIVVVGGGLTAVDTATEGLNYYAAQVEKLLVRYELFGDEIFARLNGKEKNITEKFLTHARELRAKPDQKAKILQSLGGATIIYHKSLREAPSYKLNHEELEKALEEGVMVIDNAIPLSIEVDRDNHCTGIMHSKGLTLARTILVAIGTKPNTVLAKEDSKHFSMKGKYFDDENLDDVSTLGDLHPKYAGNVVKAMASAKDSYISIIYKMKNRPPLSIIHQKEFFKNLDDLLLARILKVNRLTENIVEVVVKARSAAMNFEPGQFYRLQNYEANALKGKHNYVMAMKPLALTGAQVDRENGILSLIVLEMLGSSDFCQYLKEGELVSLMGPTGTPTTIPKNETVMLVGGGLGNAVLSSIGQAMRKNGCKVLYFAGYRRLADRYKESEIENAADIVVWCCDLGTLSINREQDLSFNCNIVEAIRRYGESLGCEIKLNSVGRMIVIGSDKMMAAVAYARHNNLKHLFKVGHIAIGSINSPMQCMMKEICAQCLQINTDTKTGEEYYVYSCAEQDQELDRVDFNCLGTRLSQNHIMEKITGNIIKQSKEEKELLSLCDSRA